MIYKISSTPEWLKIQTKTKTLLKLNSSVFNNRKCANGVYNVLCVYVKQRSLSVIMWSWLIPGVNITARVCILVVCAWMTVRLQAVSLQEQNNKGHVELMDQE